MIRNIPPYRPQPEQYAATEEQTRSRPNHHCGPAGSPDACPRDASGRFATLSSQPAAKPEKGKAEEAPAGPNIAGQLKDLSISALEREYNSSGASAETMSDIMSELERRIDVEGLRSLMPDDPTPHARIELLREAGAIYAPEVDKSEEAPAQGGRGADTHDGVYYFDTRGEARSWALENDWPTDRIVEFERGFGVQSERGGSYAGPEAAAASDRAEEAPASINHQKLSINGLRNLNDSTFSDWKNSPLESDGFAAAEAERKALRKEVTARLKEAGLEPWMPDPEDPLYDSHKAIDNDIEQLWKQAVESARPEEPEGDDVFDEDDELQVTEEERSFAFADQARGWSAGQLETAYGSGGVTSEMQIALEDELDRRLKEEGLPPINRTVGNDQVNFSDGITRLVDAIAERRRSNREEEASDSFRLSRMMLSTASSGELYDIITDSDAPDTPAREEQLRNAEKVVNSRLEARGVSEEVLGRSLADKARHLAYIDRDEAEEPIRDPLLDLLDEGEAQGDEPYEQVREQMSDLRYEGINEENENWANSTRQGRDPQSSTIAQMSQVDLRREAGIRALDNVYFYTGISSRVKEEIHDHIKTETQAWKDAIANNPEGDSYYYPSGQLFGADNFYKTMGEILGDELSAEQIPDGRYKVWAVTHELRDGTELRPEMIVYLSEEDANREIDEDFSVKALYLRPDQLKFSVLGSGDSARNIISTSKPINLNTYSIARNANAGEQELEMAKWALRGSALREKSTYQDMVNGIEESPVIRSEHMSSNSVLEAALAIGRFDSEGQWARGTSQTINEMAEDEAGDDERTPEQQEHLAELERLNEQRRVAERAEADRTLLFEEQAARGNETREYIENWLMARQEAELAHDPVESMAAADLIDSLHREAQDRVASTWNATGMTAASRALMEQILLDEANNWSIHANDDGPTKPNGQTMRESLEGEDDITQMADGRFEMYYPVPADDGTDAQHRRRGGPLFSTEADASAYLGENEGGIEGWHVARVFVRPDQVTQQNIDINYQAGSRYKINASVNTRPYTMFRNPNSATQGVEIGRWGLRLNEQAGGVTAHRNQLSSGGLGHILQAAIEEGGFDENGRFRAREAPAPADMETERDIPPAPPAESARQKKRKKRKREREAKEDKVSKRLAESQRLAAQIRDVTVPTAMKSGAYVYGDYDSDDYDQRELLESLNISQGTDDEAGEDIATLVGAADDASVSYNIYSEYINVEIEHEGYKASRTIGIDSDGKTYISNDSFFVEREFQGQGIGARQFARQVQWARQWGFDRISVSAAGESSGRGYIDEETGETRKSTAGYSVWAKFGYNGTVKRQTKINAEQDGFENVTDIHSIMRQPGGAQWWKENGHSFGGKFDLSPGSLSNQILDEYLRKLRAQGRISERFQKQRPEMNGYRGEELDFTAEEIAILDEIWADIAAGKLGEKTPDTYARPRMFTREEYAKGDHHCKEGAESSCPRDEGGKFSSKEGGEAPKAAEVAIDLDSAAKRIDESMDSMRRYMKDDPSEEQRDPQGLDQDAEFKDGVEKEIVALANRYGFTVDRNYDSQSTYWDINLEIDGNVEESFQVRASNHKQRYGGTLWSFELQNDVKSIARGLKTIEDEMKSLASSEEKTSQTNSPEFKNWFKDSKVVDESGKPLVVYHGTDKEDLDVMYDGWFSDDIEATEEFGPVVVKAYLKMENPAYDLSSVTREPGDLADLYKEYSGEEFDFWGDSNLRDVATTDVRGGFREWLIAKGHDGIVTYDDSNRVTATSYVPFSPSQIKSVENKGSFDPDDPRINYSRPRMYTKEEYARKNHHCGEGADLSGCPRDEGGRFSSKSSGKGGPIVDETATMELEFTTEEAKHQLAELIKEDGFTYDPVEGDSPEEGFVVSTYPELEQIIHVSGGWKDYASLRLAVMETMEKYVEERADTFLSNDLAHFGGWYDADNGRIYLDVVTIVDSHEEALALSKKHKQEAYYDLSTQTEHRVGAREDSPQEDAIQRAEGGDKETDGGGADRGDNEGDNGKEAPETRIASGGEKLPHFTSAEDLRRWQQSNYSRPRMYTREEYARKDHHCGSSSSTPESCPRDEGGKFSSKQGGGTAVSEEQAAAWKEQDAELDANISRHGNKTIQEAILKAAGLPTVEDDNIWDEFSSHVYDNTRQKMKVSTCNAIRDKLQGNEAFAKLVDRWSSLMARNNAGSVFMLADHKADYYIDGKWTEETPEQTATRMLVGAWAQTSSNNALMSLELQKAAELEFGVEPSGRINTTLRELQADIKDYPGSSHGYVSRSESHNDYAAYRAFLRAMYDNTQKSLADMGLSPDDTVTLYRGMKFVGRKMPPELAIMKANAEELTASFESAETKWVNQAGTQPLSAFNDGSTPVPDHLDDHDYVPMLYSHTQNPMSSFALHEDVTLGFSGAHSKYELEQKGAEAVTLRTQVKVKDILSTPISGFGCGPESEVVVLAGERPKTEVSIRWLDGETGLFMRAAQAVGPKAESNRREYQIEHFPTYQFEE